MISEVTLSLLRARRNLLAFSGGIDSTALFHLLSMQGILCDLAIVDYNRRAQSKKEVAYAHELAQRFGCKLFIKSITLPESDFEATARRARYQFFEELIATHRYDHLLTAHQLNDRLEWLLIQLTKGAGTVELVGMREIEKRAGYLLIRPLLEITKQELQQWLDRHNIPYFIDESNHDPHFMRNRIRPIAQALLAEHTQGIIRSLVYLSDDALRLWNKPKEARVGKVIIIPFRPELFRRDLLWLAKQQGILPSFRQQEMIMADSGGVLAGKIAFGVGGKFLWSSPYHPLVGASKAFKEGCRLRKVPRWIRGYLWELSPAWEVVDCALASLL